jgi:hypothetical protein
MMAEITPLQPVQVVTFGVSLLLFGAVMYWTHVEIRKGYFLYLVGPITFSLHLLIFYGTIITRELGYHAVGPLTVWSAYLRLHGLMTMVGILLMVLYRCTRDRTLT